MSVQPPRGLGACACSKSKASTAACGGTHVSNTADVGPVVVTKIEKNQP